MSPRQGRPFEEKTKSGRLEIRISSEEEKILDFCTTKTGKNRAEIVRQGIREVYRTLCDEQDCFQDEILDLKTSISCPWCDTNNRIVVYDYEVGCQNYDKGENGMGDEIEHNIECDDFVCAACGKHFLFEGTIWEYPIGTIEQKNYRTEMK